MVKNKSGQYADKLEQNPVEQEEFECEFCKTKIRGVQEFSDHLEAHQVENQLKLERIDSLKRNQEARVAHQ